MRHLVTYGSIDWDGMAQCLKKQARHKLNDILTSVNGAMSAHQRQFLSMMLGHLDQLGEHLRQIESEIERAASQFHGAISVMNSIPGVGHTAASSILAEIGSNMACFATAEHLCSWAGMSPGNNESAGKRKSTATNHGNRYVKSMLCEVAWVIAGKRNTYLSNWYWRLKQHVGAKKAIVALGRKLLVIIFTLLKNGAFYDEACFEQRRLHCERRRVSRMLSELERLGYQVVSPAVIG
jgi:transposase